MGEGGKKDQQSRLIWEERGREKAMLIFGTTWG